MANITQHQKDIVPSEIPLNVNWLKDNISINVIMLVLRVNWLFIYRLMINKYIKSIKFGSRVLKIKKDLQNHIYLQIESQYSNAIILKKTDELLFNDYFCISGIVKYYNFSGHTIQRSIIQNNIKKFKNERFVYVLKSDVVKLFGEPTKTKKNNG